MNNTHRLLVAAAGWALLICLAVSLGASCTVGNNPESSDDAGLPSDAPPGADAAPGELKVVTAPVSQDVAINTDVSLSAVIDGPIETIEWRKAGTVIAGANELQLTLKNVQLSDSGEYALIVTNAVGSIEVKATITVTAAPVINARPRAVSAYLGQSAALSVRATGAGLTYQWSKDGVSIAGQTANTLTIKPLTLKSAGTYKVTVSNISGSVSAQTTVAVHGPPVLVAGLSDTTVDVGNALFLGVAATGEGIAYTWSKDGSILAGEVTSDVQRTAALADAGRYTVTVANPAGSVTSSATVTVNDVAPALAWTYLGRISESTGLNEVFTVTLTGRANRAMTWTWNLLHTGCVLLPPTADWTGSGTIAAGTPAGAEVRRLSFGLYRVGNSPCTFGPLIVTGSYQ